MTRMNYCLIGLSLIGLHGSLAARMKNRLTAASSSNVAVAKGDDGDGGGGSNTGGITVICGAGSESKCRADPDFVSWTPAPSCSCVTTSSGSGDCPPGAEDQCTADPNFVSWTPAPDCSCAKSSSSSGCGQTKEDCEASKGTWSDPCSCSIVHTGDDDDHSHDSGHCSSGKTAETCVITKNGVETKCSSVGGYICPHMTSSIDGNPYCGCAPRVKGCTAGLVCA